MLFQFLSESQFDESQFDESQLSEAQLAVIDAKLELADTKQQQIELHQEKLAQFKKYEGYLEEMHRVGVAGKRDLILVKTERISAEIELLRAQR